jgi:hypothetical protein
LLSGAFLLLPALLIALSFTSSGAPALAVLFSAGLLAGAVNVVVITLVQLESPAEMRGRVLSIVFALAHASMPAGMALGGLLGDVSGLQVSSIIAAFGFAGLFACASASRSLPLRRLLAGTVD